MTRRQPIHLTLCSILPKQHPVLPEVLEDLRQRVEVKGMETYGRPLTTADGRDTLQDLYEELLDACVYIKKFIMERERFSGPVGGLRHVENVDTAIRHMEGWAD